MKASVQQMTAILVNFTIIIIYFIISEFQINFNLVFNVNTLNLFLILFLIANLLPVFFILHQVIYNQEMASTKCIHFLQEYKFYVQIATEDTNLNSKKKMKYNKFIEMLGTSIKHVESYEVPKVTLFGYFEITSALRVKVIAFVTTLLTASITMKIVYIFRKWS